jgi:Flp pilus assembly protein TadD
MRSNFLPRRFAASSSLLVLIGVSLAGCQTGGGGAFASSGLFTRAKAPIAASSENDWRREVSAAGERYKTNPRDAAIALRYAEALRKTGQRGQAAAVLQQASLHHPNDMRILGAYGRALADTGNLTEALDMLSRAHSPDQPDWRILSAQGAVLDQLGRNEEARRSSRQPEAGGKADTEGDEDIPAQEHRRKRHG